MKRVVIACSMMEDELHRAYRETGCRLPVHWLERGYHNTPEKLREALQREVDRLQEYDEILLAYGLCGNGTAGLVSRHAVLVIPKFDDCINLMLCLGPRKERGLAQTGSIYLTRGWTLDGEAVLQQKENYIEMYGEEEAREILEMMYEHYERIAVIDTGCYDLGAVQAYARQAGELLSLEPVTVEGSAGILEKLLLGEWDENFIVQRPGQPLAASQWEYVTHPVH
ncbi:MAG: DUF1638 domain-containing protein [Lachnospiraceae bacterium]|jgi:hypothetical protein|nr:DUF1638 domain-containing protein [Lachnospiraceae bacterium]